MENVFCIYLIQFLYLVDIFSQRRVWIIGIYSLVENTEIAEYHM